MAIDQSVLQSANQDTIVPDIDISQWPRIRLERLEVKNFGKHDSIAVNFTYADGRPMHIACLVGPNGSGKTTCLDAVQMLCSNFSGYTPERFREMMGKRIRNYMFMSGEEYMKADLMVKGIFTKLEGGKKSRYEVEFTRDGFFSSAHPEFVLSRLHHYCFATRYDMELNTFQLKRDRWPLFQDLFSSVTGYPVDEDVSIFDESSDRRMRQIAEDFVMGFTIKKDRETITHRQMSAGERKIAKSFSTALNKPVTPCIMLIDNATMHIETGRHLRVIECLGRCFPNTQLIVTCHSTQVSRSLPDRERLMDMRFLTTSETMRKAPWRLRLFDEVIETMSRLEGLNYPDLESVTSEGGKLIDTLLDDSDISSADMPVIEKRCKSFLWAATGILVSDIAKTPLPRLGPIPQ
jgi:ABC-type lipoprotein export system ATPase subunit